MIEEFNVEWKAECCRLNLAHILLATNLMCVKQEKKISLKCQNKGMNDGH